MFYIGISLLLTLGALLDCWLHRRLSKWWFLVFAAGLWVVLCLRYYQGVDYASYMSLYQTVHPSFRDTIANPPWHGEMGWHFLAVLPRRWEWPFEVFVAIIGTLSIASTCRAIWKYSPYKILSLLLMFPALYLTYMFSIIRQGLAISLFLGIGLELLMKKKALAYYILIGILTAFHTVSCVLIIVPHFIDAWGNKKLNHYFRVMMVCGLSLICILGYTDLLPKIADLFGRGSIYVFKRVSIPANLVRLIYFVAIHFLHRWNRFSGNQVEACLYKIYLLGFLLFMTTSFSALISNRMTAPMKLVEIILIPTELYLLRQKDAVHIKNRGAFGLFVNRKTLIAAALCVTILIPNVEMYKNLNGYIVDGNYQSWVTPVKYPYITVFQKDLVYEYLAQ